MKLLLQRILSLVMALLVLVSLLPLQSFATEVDSTQTPSNEESTSVETTVETADAPVEPTETSEQETVPPDEELLTGSQEEPISFYLINNKARAIVDQAVKPLTVEENALRPVNYASKAGLEEAILKKYPNVKTEIPAPEMTPLEVHLQEQAKQPDGLITKTDK